MYGTYLFDDINIMRNIIICGVIKNVKNSIENNIALCRELGKRCDNYKIILYENNSDDGTKEILEKYMNDSDCSIIMEDLTIGKHNSEIWAYTEITGSSHPCRIEQISNARNRLIDEIILDKYDAYDTVVNIDLDSSHWDVNGVLDSIDKVEKDRNLVIYGNSLRYYDFYALRSPYSKYHLLGPEVVGEIFWNNLNKAEFRINPEMSELVNVYSAFNGIGVLDRSVYKKYRYNHIVVQPIKNIYQAIFNHHHKENLYQEFKNYIVNQCEKFPGGFLIEGENGMNIYYKNNSGYDKPVVCEHVAFNFKLLENSYKICINPKMLYWR